MTAERARAVGVIFGDFQPVLSADVATLAGALSQCGRVIVALDGHGSPPSARRPWSCAQREAHIRAALPEYADERLRFAALRDHLYQPERWAAEMAAEMAAALATLGARGDALALIATRDEAQALERRGLGRLPRLDPAAPRDATVEAAVRADYLRGGTAWRGAVPFGVADLLSAALAEPGFSRLAEEQAWVDQLAEAWRVAPYPPVFVTADPVVVAHGQILMIHRTNAPAKGLWALPGGFVEQDETVAEAALRELVEETGIVLPPEALRRAVRGGRVFDHPERSVRGRSITHGLFVDLGEAGPLPTLRAGDDAASAEWWPLERFAESSERIAEDHAWIVRAFIPELP